MDEVNWGIAQYGIVPSGDAFHNLHLRGLVSRASGSLDENKALIVDQDQDVHTKIPIYVAGSADTGDVPAGLSSITDVAYKKLNREMRLNLSEADQIFVQDSLIGGASTLRSFCSVASSALLLHHMLFRLNLPWTLDITEHPDYQAWFDALPQHIKDSEHELVEAVQGNLVPEPPKFGSIHALTQYVVPDLALRDPSALGLPGNDFSVVNFSSGTVIHSGKAANAHSIRATLSALASDQLARLGTLLVPARAEVDPASGASSLVFDSSASESVWSAANTLSRVFQGDVLAAGSTPTHAGDYVEAVAGKPVRFVSDHTRASVVDSDGPGSIKFVDPAGKAGKVSEKELAGLVQQRGMKEADAASFVARVKQFKVPVTRSKK